MKKQVKFIIWLIIVIVLAITAYFAWKPEVKKVKESTTSVGDKMKSVIPDGLKIKDKKTDVNGINVTYTANLMNEGKKTLNLDKVDIIFYDKDNNELTRVVSVFNSKLKPLEGIQISSQTTMAEGSKIAKTVYKFKDKK